MLPIAASSGFAIIAVVVLAAIAAIWWLLRAESRERALEAEHEVDGQEQAGREL